MKRTVLLLAVSVLVAACSSGASSTGAAPGPAPTSRTCGTMTSASTHYQHVIWIWMENHSYSAIIGSPDAPFINSLARRCGLATNYHNISHLSLTNYIGATSGLSVAEVHKFSADCDPSSACSTASPSIFGQAASWRAYEESMPSNCDNTNAGEYAVRHNPPVYYSTLRGCSSFDVPLTRLASDLANHSLPAFAFVTPNVGDDMHDGTVSQGDSWLATHLPLIIDSSAYSSGSVVVFVTWDEGEGGTSDNCPTNSTDVGCHVATLVVSPSTTPRTTSAALFNHYALLRTTEELLHLPLLGQAAQAPSMRGRFGL